MKLKKFINKWIGSINLNKGIIGAFIGVVAHFAFIYGKEIAKQITTTRIVILAIFFLFNQIDLSDLTGLYKQVAVTSVLATLGAGTADLIGRD